MNFRFSILDFRLIESARGAGDVAVPRWNPAEPSGWGWFPLGGEHSTAAIPLG